MSIRKALLALFPVVALTAGPTPTMALCAAPPTLNGVWKGNDGGTYRVRIVGTEVWWIGTSPDNGKSWTNVFRGIRSGNVINGRWADVNGPMGAGTMTIRVNNTASMERTAAAGSGFGGTRWGRSCDDVILNPV